MKKKILLMIMASILAIVIAGTAEAAPPAFEGSVDITPDNPTIYVGESVDLTAAWSASKDVTKYEWVVDSNSQGIVAIPDEEKQTGVSTLIYSGVAPGDHEVCLSVWHHQQIDRYADDCVIIAVIDLMCTWFGETAWADGAPFNDDKGNWATYTPYTDFGITVALYAGQTLEAGIIEFSEPDSNEVTISIQLNEGWRFKDSAENVKIQGYDSAPSGNPAPGQFEWKGNATGPSFTIIVQQNSFYGVHVDVEGCGSE